MALTPSTMLPLGTKVPSFRLPDPQGKYVSSEDFRNAPALLVAFICNHCPYVKHIRAEFAKVAREYQAKGVGIVGIMSNDLGISPDDSPEKMAEEARQMGYVFPYLFDETQEVAKAYHAACTPDLYLFDGKGLLVYRGQFDASRPGNAIPVTGKDLRAALDKVLAGEAIPANQTPSIGCNIKWKSGNEPQYAMNA
jgi:peroxiredoxin